MRGDSDDDHQEDKKTSPLDYGIKTSEDYKALCEQALRRTSELEAGTSEATAP